MTDVRRLVVFRFDRDPLVCRDHVATVRALNPGVQIHGLYGGERPAPAPARWAARRLLGLDDLYVSPHDGRWNWRHADLALLEWFRASGHRIDFEVVHFIEWDLVIGAPLAEIYGHIPPGSVGLTCLTPVEELVGRWEWLDGEHLQEWHELLKHAERAWGTPRGARLACLGAGPCFPRAFLEAYAEAERSELGNDEQRLPLAAACLGFEITDTGFKRDWFDSSDSHLFNVGGPSIQLALIRQQLADRDGRRVFHPVRQRVMLSRQGW